MTKDDVRAEHEAALASLTVAQRRALERLGHAHERAWIGNRTNGEVLDALFEEEADRRSQGPVLAELASAR